MDIEKLKTLGKHIVIAFCGIVIFTVIGYVLQVANSYFSGMPNYVNGQSFGNTFYLVSIIFVILMSIDAIFILIEPFEADSLIDFIKRVKP
jgi:NADH:ubiquinone oxidoreductase subunit 3 (subunit A)